MEFSFEVDVKKEAEGEWFEPDQLVGAGRIKVRSKFTPGWKQAFRDLIVQAQRKKAKDRAKFIEDGTRIMLWEHVLVNWELKDKDGNDVPFSSELAKRFMTDDKYRPFQEAVDWAADECGKAYEERDEEDEKNSDALSDISSSSDS
jgi:hypothetical protein